MAARADDRQAFSEALSRLGEGEPERLKVREVVDAFGDEALGAVMLVFGLISLLPLPPGSAAITGVPLLFLSLQLALGRQNLWFPRRIMDASAPRAAVAKGMRRASPALRLAERLTQPRFRWLVSSAAERIIGGISFLLAIMLILPIPLGNVAPSAAIALFSLGVMQRDGVAVLLGGVATGISGTILVLGWKVMMLGVTELLSKLGS